MHLSFVEKAFPDSATQADSKERKYVILDKDSRIKKLNERIAKLEGAILDTKQLELDLRNEREELAEAKVGSILDWVCWV
jgi:TolA-binding protein